MMFIARFQVSKDDDHLWDYIVREFERMKSRDVVPLYVTQRNVRNETSLIVDAKDLNAMSAFLMENFSHDDRILNMRVVNLMDPVFFPVSRDMKDFKRFTVTVCCRSPRCKEVYTQLARIRPTRDIAITYIAFTFQDCGNSITMSVLSRDEKTIETFVKDEVDAIEGAVTMGTVWIRRTMKLASFREWQKAVHPITRWEEATSCEFDEEILRDVVAGC